jgi:hypothetical protein
LNGNFPSSDFSTAKVHSEDMVNTPAARSKQKRHLGKAFQFQQKSPKRDRLARLKFALLTNCDAEGDETEI